MSSHTLSNADNHTTNRALFMNRPRILVITPDDVLRDRDGLSVYTGQMLHAISRHADVEVLCLKPSSGRGAMSPYRCHHIDCRTIQFVARVRSTISAKPSYTFEYRKQRIVASAEALIRQFGPEVVVFNHRRAAWLIRHIGVGDGVRRVYVCHNAEARSIQTLARLIRNPVARFLAGREARKTAVLEEKVISDSDKVICISREDVSDLRLEERGINHAVIPPWMPDRPRRVPEDGGPPTILLAGSLNWSPKLKNAAWFTNEILPRIRKQRPETRLIVAGLEASRLQKHLGSTENIEIHESPDSLDPFFAEASVFVIPERQEGGLKIKSVDAASRGFPIVSTAAGVSGAHLKHEQHVLIADSADEFSAAVLRFFENPDLARRLGNSARALAEKYFNREVVDASWVRHIVPGV